MLHVTSCDALRPPDVGPVHLPPIQLPCRCLLPGCLYNGALAAAQGHCMVGSQGIRKTSSFLSSI